MKIEELLLIENKKQEESILRKIVRKEPTNVIACIKLGNILREKRHYTEALKLHQVSLTGTRDISLRKKLYVNIIKDYIDAGNPESALNFANELQRIVLSDVDELNFLLSIYEDLSKWQKAIHLKQRILKLSKSSDDRELAILYAFWGNSLVEEGSKREALKRFKEALKLDKFCLPGLLFIGDFYYEDGNIDEGIKFWKRILDNIPKYAFLAFEKLADAYYTKSDFSKLETLYASFLNQNPEDARVLIMLSEIYEKKGEDKEAIVALERAREIDPRSVVARRKLFKLYYDNKRYKDMFKEGEKIASLDISKDFKCYKCNSQLEEFKFKCPHCNNWLSIR